MVTLTVEESLRLIARAIAVMPKVQEAKQQGMIGFCLCTSAGFVVQELIGADSVDPAKYCCGFIYHKGSCSVPPKHREKQLLLDKGRPRWLNFPEENLSGYLGRMGADDIVIKSGNVLDPNGEVGVLLASPDGGEAGNYLPVIAANGIQLIIPMPLTKSIPVALTEVLPYMGISKFASDRVNGMACGMQPLPGKVVTEIEALRILFGLKAVPAAMGSGGSGAGTVTLVLIGEKQMVDAAWQFVNEIKGEPKMKNYFSNCKDCLEGKLKNSSARCSTRLKTV
jgi:hypothetical protein